MTETTASVPTPFGGGSIPVLIDKAWDCLERTDLLSGPVVFLVDNRVTYFHGEELGRTFDKFPNKVVEVFYASERAKLIGSVAAFIGHISRFLPARRGSTLVAIGGGTTLNVAGFVASTVGRGINLVVAPTTPMAVSDVAFGSKHGINVPSCKNYVGTYYDPSLIILNTSSLQTIPRRVARLNSIECVKQSLVASRERFEAVRSCLLQPRLDYSDLFNNVLWPNALQKMKLLCVDPTEVGAARILRFGHQVAHALEIASDFVIGHDRAVALGMALELTELTRRGMFPERDLADIISLVESLGVDISGNEFREDAFVEAMRMGKMALNNDSYDLIRLKGIGSIGSVDEDLSWPVGDAVNAAARYLR